MPKGASCLLTCSDAAAVLSLSDSCQNPPSFQALGWPVRTRCPSCAASCHALLGTSPRTGVRPTELARGGGRDDWLSFILPCSSYSEEAHIWIKDGVSNRRGFSPSTWVPQCLTEPGTPMLLLSSPRPLLPGATEAEPGHTPRTLAEEGPDFIPSSSLLTSPSGALLILQALGVQKLMFTAAHVPSVNRQDKHQSSR